MLLFAVQFLLLKRNTKCLTLFCRVRCESDSLLWTKEPSNIYNIFAYEQIHCKGGSGSTVPKNVDFVPYSFGREKYIISVKAWEREGVGGGELKKTQFCS